MKVRDVLKRGGDTPLKKTLRMRVDEYDRVRQLCDELQRLTGIDPLEIDELEPYYIDLMDAEIVYNHPIILQVADRTIVLGPAGVTDATGKLGE